MQTRVLVSALLLPFLLGFVALGGWAYGLVIAGLVIQASLEYAGLFQTAGLRPAGWLIAASGAILVLGRAWAAFDLAPLAVSLIILAVMTWYVMEFERGNPHAATDFAISLAGVFYLGWLGAYLVSLRALPDGLWWTLTVLSGVWAADSFAYLVGSRIGRHKMAPHLSPKKSWEGYLGGIVLGVPVTALLALVWQALAAITGGGAIGVTPLRAAWVGLAMTVFPTLGDLGESMIKRQVGVKDSGNLLPGHGGIFDRIDSWLWGAVIGYYLIVYWFL